MPRRNRRHGDPYRGFTIRVKWDGATIPGITSVGPLLRTVEVTEFREGGSAGAVLSLPGRTTLASFVLRRPLSNNHAFEQWANLPSTQGQNLAPFRKDVRLELHTAQGHIARAYTLHKCWVQAYEALPTLNVEARHSVMETLTLHFEGWERDTTIPASP
jgi:phage tail-like protein